MHKKMENASYRMNTTTKRIFVFVPQDKNSQDRTRHFVEGFDNEMFYTTRPHLTFCSTTLSIVL